MNMAQGRPERHSSRPIVHVGPTKTASTWLQEVVFPGLQGVEVLGRKAVGEMDARDQELLEETWRIVRDPDDVYQPGGLARLVAEARPADGRLLVADEGLLSTMRYLSRDQLDRAADRLHDEVPDAQIVLVIRNPVTLIASTYRHYVRRGGTLGPKRFCRASTPGFTFCPESFDMGYLYDLFDKRYGTNDIVVLVYEDLAGDSKGVLDTLISRLGVAASPQLVEAVGSSGARNASLSTLTCSALRQANRLFSSRFNPDGPVSWFSQGRLSGRVRRLDERLGVRRWKLEQQIDRRGQAIFAQVGSQYAQSHARLAEATGLDLRSRGYPWPA
jgi:hypothetical protein